jgi:ribosomal protein L37AE/L43A
MTLEIGDKIVMVGPRVGKDDEGKYYRVLPGGVLVKRECDECGKEFVVRRTDQLYCSKTCGHRARQARYRKKVRDARACGPL